MSELSGHSLGEFLQLEKTFDLVCKNQRMNIVHDDLELFFNGTFNLIFLLMKGLFCIDMVPALLKEEPRSVVACFVFVFFFKPERFYCWQGLPAKVLWLAQIIFQKHRLRLSGMQNMSSNL